MPLLTNDWAVTITLLGVLFTVGAGMLATLRSVPRSRVRRELPRDRDTA